ncbi:FtsW/RodA/SpoVE family cell cycle protein [Ructibacterium gallinarum]|uniref:FtsW/RodA/SpoVE family cell cycle protein n=1 Tax=Ructibacterium gallinarum TaxID=2779355 RepID=A0A9D5M2M0_9FIRM|nr:FtsW/RodA/SpoVE family cell cycle protein [Ructibacterium gallinarum]MBE5039539.1 FtsW/RodA/SpoVE family cell cycle protein [Ructibacterium gallinarum]
MGKFKGLNYRRPAYLLMLMNMFGFGLLFVANSYNPNILYVGAGLLGLFILMYTIIVLCRMGDKFIMLMACMLITIGVLLLCRIKIDYGIRQIMWVAIGGAAFFTVYVVYYNIRFWNRMWFLYLALGTGLFLATLLFGKVVNGSKNWISLGGFSFQPAEITKILFIMFLACYYSGSWNKPFLRLKPKWVTMLGTYLFIGFLVLQRDWGTILVLFAIYIFMIYVYEKGYGFLAGNVGVAAIVALLGYKFLYHIQVRVSAWLDPWSDIADKGYQITQSLFAIASGGYFGRGLGNGSPNYIPEVHSDFIFAAVCEEMGVFGGAAIIILFFLIAYRCFKISITAQDPFDKAVCLGLTLMFAVQTFIIVGGVIKMIPLTGITLPFVSYGGTSIVVNFASLGIIQAISAKEERGTGGAGHESK